MQFKKSIALFALLILFTGCKTGDVFSSAKDTGPQDVSNHLKRITFAEADNGTQVKLYGTRPFQYTTYKLSKPLRLAVELPGVTLDFKARKMLLKDKNIAAISVVTFHKVNSVRVEMELYADSSFKVNRKNDYLEVIIASGSSSASTSRVIAAPVQNPTQPSDSSTMELNRKLLESKQTILDLEEKNLILTQQAQEAQKQLEETRSMAKTQQARILFMEEQLNQIETRIAERLPTPRSKPSVTVPVPTPKPYEPPELVELLSYDDGSPKTTDDTGKVEAKKSIQKTLEGWLASWNEEDINAYKNFYSDRFKSSKGQGKTAFIINKTATFAHPGAPTISIKRIEAGVEGDMAQVSFLQKYRSKTLKSTVWKRLTLTLEGNEWRIITEKWGRKRLPIF